jgi:hypothetical protein
VTPPRFVRDLPREVTSHLGHAYVYARDDGLVIEHTVGGRWVGCQLGRAPLLSRQAGVLAIEHLRRRRHDDGLPLELLASHHAGGGIRHQGVWIKGPGR